MNWTQTVLAAIQKAVDGAAEKGVAVEVSIIETGFFATERTEIKIIAKPKVKP